MPVLANPTSALSIPTTYLFVASLVLLALVFHLRNKKSSKMSEMDASSGPSFSDQKVMELENRISSQPQQHPSLTNNPQTPPNRHSLAAHSFATSPTSISPNSIFTSFPEPTLSLSPIHNNQFLTRGLNEDTDRPKHPHSQTYPPPFPLSDENPASFFTTELAEEPSVFSSDSTSKSTSHSASDSTSTSASNSSEQDPSTPRRRSYTKPVPGSEMVVQGEIIVAEGWRRHTRVFGGGVCKACEESSSEMERRRRLGLPVPPIMMNPGGVES